MPPPLTLDPTPSVWEEDTMNRSDSMYPYGSNNNVQPRQQQEQHQYNSYHPQYNNHDQYQMQQRNCYFPLSASSAVSSSSQIQLQHQQQQQQQQQQQHQDQQQYQQQHQALRINSTNARVVSSTSSTGGDSFVSWQGDPSADNDFEMDDVSILDSVMLVHNKNNNNHDMNDPTNCCDNSSVSSNQSCQSSVRRYGRSLDIGCTAGSVIYENEPTHFPYQGLLANEEYYPQNGISSSSSFQRSNRRQNSSVARKVVFAEDALLYSCDRYSHEEIIGTWYDRDELAAFKVDRKDIVKVLKKHNFNLNAVLKSSSSTKNNNLCLRGYEAYFSIQGNKELRKNRELVLKTVLNEQKRQRQQSLSSSSSCNTTIITKKKISCQLDPIVIAKCSSDASRWARDYASKLGQQDEEEMLRVYGYQDHAVMVNYDQAVSKRTAAASIQKDCKKSLDMSKLSNAVLWDLIIDKSIDDVIDFHEAEYIREAMECSMLEQQQQQQPQQMLPFNGSHQQQPQPEASPSAELLRMQIEQLRVLRQHQLQKYEQMHVLQHERENQIQLFEQQQQQQYSWGFNGSNSTEEQQLQQQFLYQQQQHHFPHHHDVDQQQQQQQFNDAERQQILRLRQMELEQQRQQEQLRLMEEAQRKMEEEIRQRRSNNITSAAADNHCTSATATTATPAAAAASFDEDLASALKLVEALQFQQQYPGM